MFMGKKMKLPFLSNQTDHHNPLMSPSSSSTWPWPSCTQTRTLSFRATNDNMFKTMNTTFLDTTTMAIDDVAEPPHQDNSNSSVNNIVVDPVEAVIQGLRSERLLFVEPGETSSILEEANNNNYKPKSTAQVDGEDDEELVVVPFKESVALSLESQNPYLDFKVSMEEMVEAHGIKEWEGLEELLCWYLKMNGKDNHGYIVGAFVDLLVGLAFDNISSTSSDNITNTKISTNANTSTRNIIKSCRCSNCDSPYSPLSFYNSSSSSSSSSSASSSISSSSSSTPNCVPSLIGVTSDQEIETPCLSSLLESTEEETNEEEEDDDDVSS